MKDKWLSIIVGSLFGILMAVLVLYLMSSCLYAIFSIGFWISVVIVCALPHCFYTVKHDGYQPTISVIIMVILSYVITLLYGNVVSNASQYSNIISNIFLISTVLHVLCFVSILIRLIISHQVNNKMK